MKMKPNNMSEKDWNVKSPNTNSFFPKGKFIFESLAIFIINENNQFTS